MKALQIREQRKERTWRMLRQTSTLAAGVLLVLLLAIDAYFRFESAQLNLTITGLAVFFLVLWRIDLLLHRAVGVMRHGRNALDQNNVT